MSWSEADAQEFQARLKRTRGVDRRSQYLRIQAHHLFETTDPALTRPALSLLEQLFAEAPSPPQLALAHVQAARCHERLKDPPSAFKHLRMAVAAQEAHPNTDAGAPLAFGWFVATNGMSEYYPEAERLLAAVPLILPVQLFQARAIDALLAASRGDTAAAGRHAAAALAAAHARSSPFTRHSGLGVVGPEYRPIIDQLERLITA